MRQIVSEFVQEVLEEMYPERLSPRSLPTIQGSVLDEVRISDAYSELGPLDPDISTVIGPLQLAVPFIPAPMDTVTGAEMAKVMHEIGTFGPIYRHPEQNTQLDWIEDAINFTACLIKKPKSLHPDERLYKAWDILKKYGFSTIPVTTNNEILKGVLFTGDIAFTEIKERLEEPVKKWMRPFDELKVSSVDTPFSKIKRRLLDEERCSMLPIINDDRRLCGIYFMKDLIFAKPSMHNGKPLVGMAISDMSEDLDRARMGLELGIGAVIIDSSHGNCKNVIEQTKKVAALKKELGLNFAIIVGNIANIDGYYRLAMAGADAVKCGIGSGSICTTSGGTGIGVPMFTVIRQLSFLREKMKSYNMPTPEIIPDGGISNTGNLVTAISSGGHVCMSGEWFAAAAESISADGGKGVIQVEERKYIRYRGMASDGAIKDRSSIRYGKGKSAAEGIEGTVLYRGPLKQWIRKDLELIRGGFAHTGSKNIKELQEFGNWPFAFYQFSSSGISQIETRVKRF